MTLAENTIRRCHPAEITAIDAIINEAAQVYRGVIPADRWKEPYMPSDELSAQIAAGVEFWGYEQHGALVGVMGLQHRDDVDLIRHAYVRPSCQGQGIGGLLLNHLLDRASRPVLIGTWAAASWAIHFYEKHGFRVVSPETKDSLLRRYWSIPERQIETSVVLADARWFSLQPGAESQSASTGQLL